MSALPIELQTSYYGRISSAPLEPLLEALERIESLPKREFERWIFDIVQRYRRFEDDQEAIAYFVTRKNVSTEDAVARERLEELFAMLMAVHDPLV